MAAQFEPPPAFAAAHVGRFFGSLDREKWARAVDAPAVNPVVERFDGEGWDEFMMSFRAGRPVPSARTQIVTAGDDRMIQIDRNWFTFNWRRRGDSGYPSFNLIRPEFTEYYGKFRETLRTGGVELPPANLWEVIYVNKLAQGDLWSEPEDLRTVFPTLLATTSLDFAKFSDIGGEWVFTLDAYRARLRVILRTALEDGQRIARLNMVARGPIGSGEGSAQTVEQGHDIGHAAIVHGFTRLTSAEAHERWERTQ